MVSLTISLVLLEALYCVRVEDNVRNGLLTRSYKLTDESFGDCLGALASPFRTVFLFLAKGRLSSMREITQFIQESLNENSVQQSVL